MEFVEAVGRSYHDIKEQNRCIESLDKMVRDLSDP